MFLKCQSQDKKKKIITTQSTLFYQRFQLFTVQSTPEKQLQNFRKCKVVTVGNLPNVLSYCKVLLGIFCIFNEMFIYFDLLSLTNNLKYVIPKWMEPTPYSTGCD